MNNESTLKKNHIVIEKGLLKKKSWIDFLRSISKHWVIITDENIKPLWAENLRRKLETDNFAIHLISVPPGEKSKTRKQKEKIEDEMLKKGLGRDAAVLAIGGGMITDLAGFIAATYCRGIPLVSIPSTLLGMVDASIGGKVAVNTSKAKNMIGTFYSPSAVFMDSDILDTLPQKEILNGLAEVIKYGLISDPTLLENLCQINDSLISRCCQIKSHIVEKDPLERGLRRILNYGHTVGHAIETAAGYQIGHGEAVAIGMIAEGYLSVEFGFLKNEELVRIVDLLKSKGFSLRLPVKIDAKKIMRSMFFDKKSIAHCPRFVLLESIGCPLSFNNTYCTKVDEKSLHNMMSWMSSKSFI